MKTEPTTYWTFFCNPRRWQIDDFLRSHRDEDDYRVIDWQATWFAPGQLGVVRVGVDTRTRGQLAGRRRLEPGIYAIVQVVDSPKLRPNSTDPYWLEAPPEGGEHLAVDIRYIKNLLDRPLLLESLKSDLAVTDRFLLDGFQGASMPLDPGTFHRILDLSGTEPHAFDAEPGDSLADLERRYAGASPEVKEVVSRHIERGPVAAKVKEATGYRCQVCLALGQNPFSFRKRDGEPYVEAHHVTFVSRLEPGSLGPSNIITVCADHHRQLHYGIVELAKDTAEEFVFVIDGVALRVPKISHIADTA
ncbi:hypothetical protein [Tautonia plasticadhaerens]|uniref:hypothetical protein n=1 Tax=Tautonia plasticadhaerens TaxID=2527974 RepID=UPI0011A78E04|nr:hypothetical protein [Tautonia plasticadhaerens]